MGAPEQSEALASAQGGEADWDAALPHLAPSARAIMLRVCTVPFQKAHVEHLLCALLQPVQAGEGWIELYAVAEREQVLSSAREAVQRTGTLLAKLGVDVEELRRAACEMCQAHLARAEGVGIEHSRDFGLVWQSAALEAQAMRCALVWPEHVVLAILKWGRPRHPWSVWPLRRDRAEQVLAALRVQPEVARVVARGLLEGEVEEELPWTIRVQKAVDAAHTLSIKTHCGRIAPAHLLLALLRDDEDAREACKYLQLEDVDLESLRQRLRAGIHGDGEASTSRPRFSKQAALVLDKCKAMSRGAGFRRIDEAGLLLCLALHGGESAQPWRQVLGEERAREQVKRLYSRASPRRVATRASETARDEPSWKPRGALNWVAFLTAPVAWPLGFVLANHAPRGSTAFYLAMTLVFLPLGWLVASVFALMLGRPPAFKDACTSFLSGFGLSWMLVMLGLVIWNLLQAVLRL